MSGPNINRQPALRQTPSCAVTSAGFTGTAVRPTELPVSTSNFARKASPSHGSELPASWPRKASRADNGAVSRRQRSLTPRQKRPRPTLWAATSALRTALRGDITYIRTWEGWAYLATVIDLASRRIVGFCIADHMRASLVEDALKMALKSRRPQPGLIFHSDRGSQYTSRSFRLLLAQNQVRQSLSRPGQCWDNAVAESFFGTLKTELVHRHAWQTRAAVRLAVFEYIEVFYNRIRIHSALGYRAPATYEACTLQPHHPAAPAA